jgi:hypothetical protein
MECFDWASLIWGAVQLFGGNQNPIRTVSNGVYEFDFHQCPGTGLFESIHHPKNRQANWQGISK